jgi:hypothetical protein
MVAEGHGGGHEGMNMAEEMGIFIVNIASTQSGKTAPGAKNPNAPVPLNPKPANASASATPKFAGAPAAGHSHGHGGAPPMKLRRRNGMLIDIPEAAEWVYV